MSPEDGIASPTSKLISSQIAEDKKKIPEEYVNDLHCSGVWCIVYKVCQAWRPDCHSMINLNRKAQECYYIDTAKQLFSLCNSKKKCFTLLDVAPEDEYDKKIKALNLEFIFVIMLDRIVLF